jgi:hypothetical protein
MIIIRAGFRLSASIYHDRFEQVQIKPTGTTDESKSGENKWL